jgi:PAS domain S-box-containing protein
MTIDEVAGREEFAAFLEVVPDAIVGVSDDGAILFVNSLAASLFGRERSELIDEPIELLIPRSFRDVLSRGQNSEAPHTLLHVTGHRKDGSEFPAEISWMSAQPGGKLMFTAAIRNITRRKPHKATFRGVVEAAEDAAVGVDGTGHIALVNEEAEELFGYTRTELIDQPLDMLVPGQVGPPNRPQRVDGRVNRRVGAGKPLEGRRKDGSEFPVEISLSAIDTDDGPLVSAAIRDASDRVESRREEDRATVQNERDVLESRLHQSHRLESLGQLAGGVAHDFNNLLAAILNYVGFVEEEVGKEIETGPDEARVRLTAVLSDVGQIGAAAERAAALTHQLLAFARREVRNVEVLDINSTVSEVETLLRRTLGEHVELITHGPSNLKSVRADRGQMEQVLLNLAVNARDAMPLGGTLRVDSDNFTVDDEYSALHPVVEPGSYVRMRVSDTGTGMDEETVERAFEPFFSTKPKDNGTGLGLATVYGIVSQTAGLVELDSKLGVGTTVTILLPSVASAVTKPALREQLADVMPVETILVVEDEELVLDVATRILTQYGYRVLSARCGEEAFAITENHQGTVHLLLTDVVMPGETGMEIAERVSALRPGIRVLYMSGYPESVIASQGVIETGITLVSKPFKAADLLAHVRSALDA